MLDVLCTGLADEESGGWGPTYGCSGRPCVLLLLLLLQSCRAYSRSRSAGGVGAAGQKPKGYTGVMSVCKTSFLKSLRKGQSTIENGNCCYNVHMSLTEREEPRRGGVEP